MILPLAIPAILAIVTASLAIVTAPVLAIVTSPDTATSVALLEPLPTSILALSKSSSLVNSIPALLLTSALTTTPDPIAAVPVTLPEPSNEADVQVTSPVDAIVLPVAKAVAVSALPVTLPVTLPSTFETTVPVVIVKFPVLAPVKDPVPTLNLSSDSSHPIKALSELPLSITSPASLAGVPLVPLPNSIKASLMVELVVSIVVVVPFISKLPAITTLLSNVAVLVTSKVPAISILSANLVPSTASLAICAVSIEPSTYWSLSIELADI